MAPFECLERVVRVSISFGEREIIGGLPTELIIHFFYTLSQNLKANIHLSVNGDDDHHKAESCFKCFGRAFSQAINKSSKSGVPSTKGTL